eukprot:2891548-Ditylum_brightwellii.AAC.1
MQRKKFTLKGHIPKMSGMQLLCKHFKMGDVEIGSGFEFLAKSFICKTSTLKVKNSQEYNLCISVTKK